MSLLHIELLTMNSYGGIITIHLQFNRYFGYSSEYAIIQLEFHHGSQQ